jgi:nitrate/nitrite-specific signal transduction histidine kinase
MRFDEASRPELLTALRSLLKEHEEMQQQLKELEAAHRRLVREHAALERENATLSHLQVASRLLHRSLDRKEVTTAIQEIIINLVGSEQVALFDYEGRSKRLTLISSFGIDAQAWASIPVGEGPIGDCIRTGEIQILLDEEADPAEGRPSVCVPLRLDQKVMGVLVLFKLLAHKTGLEEVDFALFDLLSQQAGVALVSTSPTGARLWK